MTATPFVYAQTAPLSITHDYEVQDTFWLPLNLAASGALDSTYEYAFGPVPLCAYRRERSQSSRPPLGAHDGPPRATTEVRGSPNAYDVHRAGDGVSGHEGGFLLCSFWLVDALIHARELEEAKTVPERLLALENDVGLDAEEAAAGSGEPLGNFSQAFTHMALVISCAHLSAARAGELPPPDRAYDFAEFAYGRLMRPVT